MCRNIRTLHHFEPPATEAEIEAAALQFVRKVSGTRAPSKKNRDAFDRAVAEIAAITRRLVLEDLEPHGPPRTREVLEAQARARGRLREERMRARILAERGDG